MTGKKGFTLTELIIVIAILAILAGILVPLMVGYLSDAQAATCSANIDSMSRAYGYAKTLAAAKSESKQPMEMLAAELAKTFPRASVHGSSIDGACPSGGTYTAAFDANGNLSLECSKHPPEVFNASSSLQSTFAAQQKANNWDFPPGWRIDSNAASNSASRAKKMQDALKAAGVQDVAAWVIINSKNSGMQYVWTTYDISGRKNNSGVPAIGYDENSGTYTVGVSTVQVKSGLTTIAPDAQNTIFNPKQGQTFANYADAVAYYKTLQPVADNTK